MSISNNKTLMKNMLDCYEQQGAWETGDVLLRHNRESDASYLRRKASFCSPALYRHLIDVYDALFSKDVIRTGQGSTYAMFLDDAGGGQTLSEVINDAVKAAAVQGSCFLIVDAPIDQPDSLEGMINQRTFPFVETIFAHQVTDIVVNRLGEIVKFGYSYSELDSVGDSVSRIKVYTDHTVTIYDSQGVLVESSTIRPRMPIVPITFGKLVSGTLPPSPTLSLYQNQKAIAQTLSLVDEALMCSQFAVLVVTGPDNISDLVLGASNALKLSEGSTASFIAPPSTPCDLMLKRVETAVQSMLDTFITLVTGNTVQSGLAKTIDRSAGAMALRSVALKLEKIEWKIYEIFHQFVVGEATSDYVISYFKDYDVSDLASYIASASALNNLGISAEAKLAIRRQALRKFLGDMDPLELQQILAGETIEKVISPVVQIEDAPVVNR